LKDDKSKANIPKAIGKKNQNMLQLVSEEKTSIVVDKNVSQKKDTANSFQLRVLPSKKHVFFQLIDVAEPGDVLDLMLKNSPFADTPSQEHGWFAWTKSEHMTFRQYLIDKLENLKSNQEQSNANNPHDDNEDDEDEDEGSDED